MITGIVGVERGGTSAVAGVVFHLGIPMHGEDTTLDDNELYQNPRAWEKRTGDYAWKHTKMWQRGYNLDFTDRFIFVFRDAVASAMHGYDDLIEEKLWHRFNEYSTFKTDKPHLYVSYEKLLLDKGVTVGRIADFLGVPVTEAALSVVDNTRGYFNIKTNIKLKTRD